MADACVTPSTEARSEPRSRLSETGELSFRGQPTPASPTSPRGQASPAPRSGQQSPAPQGSQTAPAHAERPESQSAPRSARASATPKQAKEWVKSVNAQVHSARALRAQLRHAAAPVIPKARALHSKIELGSMKRCLEDKLKMREATEKSLAAGLAQREESYHKTLFQIERRLDALQKQSSLVWVFMNMADKRLDLRKDRPEEETIADELQDALTHEKAELHRWHKKLASPIKEAEGLIARVKDLQDQMLARRLTLPYVRGPEPHEWIANLRAQEDEMLGALPAFDAAVQESAGAIDKSKARTRAAMKSVMARLVRARRQLESEIHQNHAAMVAAEGKAAKLRKKLRRFYDAPENAELSGGDSKNNFSSSKMAQDESIFTADNLEMLRAKIKAAAYTGHGGRELDKVFRRYDLNGSGDLDEDELRRVLRRTFRIPTSVVSDPEISALFLFLDIDSSGSVVVSEVIEFLRGEQSEHEETERRFNQTMDLLAQMRKQQAELTHSFQLKTQAWIVQRAVEAVNRVHAMELDAPPAPLDSPSSPSSEKRQKPLEPRIADKIRQKLKRATETAAHGRDLEEFFGQLDKDGSGELDVMELLKALRELLQIPEYTVSDAEVCSLFVMLDKDKSGHLDIRELVAFLSPEHSSQPSSHQQSAELRATNPRLGPESSAAARRSPPLSSVGLERARHKVQEAVLEHARGRDLAELFGGAHAQLQDEEVSRILRRVLRLPAGGMAGISDGDISALCATLDKEGVGTVKVSKLVEFVDLDSGDSPAGHRPPNRGGNVNQHSPTGRRPQSRGGQYCVLTSPSFC